MSKINKLLRYKNNNVSIIFNLFNLLVNKSEEYQNFCHNKNIKPDGLKFWRSIKLSLDDNIELLSWNEKLFTNYEKKLVLDLHKYQEEYEILHFLYQIVNIPYKESKKKKTNNLRKFLQVGLNIGQLEYYYKKREKYKNDKLLIKYLEWYGKRRNKILNVHNFTDKLNLKNINKMENMKSLYVNVSKTLDSFLK